MRTVSPTMRRRQLGRELRDAREAKGISREAVFKATGMSPSTVSRYEGGTTGLRVLELRALMDLFQINDPEERDRLEALRAEGRKRGWWSQYRSALKPTYQTFIGMEDSAIGRRDFASIVVPGLLQTEEYARAVLATALPELTTAVIEDRVEVRMQRQALITREDEPLKLHVLLDEAAVQRRVGGEEVWADQLRHLLDMTSRRNLTIQVVPFSAGAFAESLGAFTLLDFEEGDPIAFAEMPTGDLYAEGDDALKYVMHFDALRTAALPPSLSVRLIRGWLDE